MTRTKRFEKRMVDLECRIWEANLKAIDIIGDYKNKISSDSKNTLGLTQDQQQIVNDIKIIQEYGGGGLIQPITSLARTVLKMSGGDLDAYDKAVAAGLTQLKDDDDRLFIFPPMSLVKITGNPINNEYPLNTPILVMEGNQGCMWDNINQEWLLGNQIPNNIECYDICTVKDARDLIKNLDSLPLGKLCDLCKY